MSAPEPSSPRLATPVIGVAPLTSPIYPVPQEHDVLGSAVKSASPEIQAGGEGSGAGLLPEPEEDNAQITNLVRSTWAAAYEADAPGDKDEEAAACHRLGWARVRSTGSSFPR